MPIPDAGRPTPTDPPVPFRWPIALGFAVLCFAVGYPGKLNADSLYSIITMAGRGTPGNWHSAMLGWLWSLPGGAIGQPAGALLVQAMLVGVYAGFVPRLPATRAGRAVLAVELGFRFVVAGIGASIGKDVVMLLLLLIVVQVLRYALHRRLPPALAVLLSGAVALFLVVKAPNFVVLAVAAALVMPFVRRPVGHRVAAVAVVLVVGALSVPLDRTIDRTVFHTQDLHPDKQLVIFDLAALSHGTGIDMFARMPGWPTATLPPVERCFLPYMWDAFAPWGPCSGYSAAFDAHEGALTRLWVAAVIEHPVVYVRHRLTYLGYLMRSTDHASWGISGDAINDPASPAARAEMQEMMARLKADHPVQPWRYRAVTAPSQWIESTLLKFPGAQLLATLGSLAIILLGWTRRGAGVRWGAIVPAGLAVGNVAMLSLVGVADPARYCLPTTGLFCAALLAIVAPRQAGRTG